MNRRSMKETFGRFIQRLEYRAKDYLLLVIIGGVLIFFSWKIFNDEPTTSVFSNRKPTETEARVAYLISEIDGVGEADVMICETEEGVTGVVVVCDGANNLQTLINIREAVAAALGTEESVVKIYLKK